MRVFRVAGLAVVAALGLALIPAALPTGPSANLDAAGALGAGRLGAGALLVFLGGLLTALTPCVYPLIPITVGVFGARPGVGRGKAVLLTSSYVVGMGVVFATLGVIAARTGAAFGQLLGHPAVAIGLAVFLLVLAASMFGAFELTLPQGLALRLNSVGGSGMAGAFLMGSVAGFLAAPCTGPVLTGLLTYVATTRSTVVGAGLLFVYALGIGVPFFLIGVFAVRLPKSGAWMDWVKSALGILLVALAATYVRDAFPALRSAAASAARAWGTSGGVWLAALLAAAGILLGAIHRQFGTSPRDALLKGAGVVLVTGAVLLRLSALNVGVESTGLVWNLRYAGEGTQPEPVDAALARARAEHKPVMIDFFAEWCAACKELDRETYVAPAVVEEAERFIRIKVDGTNAQDPVDALYQRFGVNGLPTVAFVSSDGKVLDDPRVTGFLGPEKFTETLRQVR
ncbi:MAG TPA: cytochrome c biogenesis protein CcdA [Myxococcaceae bacterium]|nr:cytochrome c biogenesis protein CcdA [Myxococcaceae bacterium]